MEQKLLDQENLLPTFTPSGSELPPGYISEIQAGINVIKTLLYDILKMIEGIQITKQHINSRQKPRRPTPSLDNPVDSSWAKEAVLSMQLGLKDGRFYLSDNPGCGAEQEIGPIHAGFLSKDMKSLYLFPCALQKAFFDHLKESGDIGGRRKSMGVGAALEMDDWLLETGSCLPQKQIKAPWSHKAKWVFVIRLDKVYVLLGEDFLEGLG